MNEEPDLGAWVYWAVAGAAIAFMLALAWFTAAFDIPMGGVG